MQDGKESGWFVPETFANALNDNFLALFPNYRATNYTRQIILAKMHAENYARSNGVGAKLLAETYAKKVAEQENALINWFRFHCNRYYSKDSHSRFYRTEQDEVIEVTTKEELENRISS